MIKKLILIVLVCFVSITPSQQTLAATKAKAGAKCTKANSIQVIGTKKFTCIKSGSRFVWNKGISITRPPAPTPAPSASPATVSETKPNPFDISPFPDEFTRDEMINAVFKSFDNHIKSNYTKKTFKLIIHFEYERDSIAIEKFVNDTYAILPFPADYPRTVFVVGRNIELLENSIKEYGSFDRTGSRPNDFGPACLGCAGVGWGSAPNGLDSVIPHEIFHIWQKAALKRVIDNNPDPSNPLNSPVWFDEGSAEFFAQALYSKRTNFYKPSGVLLQPYKLIDYATRKIDSGLPYHLGRIASEYIVASKGMENLLAIFWNIGNGQNFPTAFENALGISLSDFYEKFDRNLQKML